MIDLDDQPADPSGSITIKFHASQDNWDRLYSAAALNGESVTEALNRAMALYQAVTRNPPGTLLTWAEDGGACRIMLMAPKPYGIARLDHVPRFLGWVLHRIRRPACRRQGHDELTLDDGHRICMWCGLILERAPR